MKAWIRCIIDIIHYYQNILFVHFKPQTNHNQDLFQLKTINGNFFLQVPTKHAISQLDSNIRTNTFEQNGEVRQSEELIPKTTSNETESPITTFIYPSTRHNSISSRRIHQTLSFKSALHRATIPWILITRSGIPLIGLPYKISIQMAISLLIHYLSCLVKKILFEMNRFKLVM